jgi:hypothetical protein
MRSASRKDGRLFAFTAFTIMKKPTLFNDVGFFDNRKAITLNIVFASEK